MNGILPPWAISENKTKELLLGSHLATRDGRKIGNAHIIDYYREGWDDEVMFVCLTDAGNTLRLSENEVHEYFYIGDWVSSVSEIIARFGRKNED